MCDNVPDRSDNLRYKGNVTEHTRSLKVKNWGEWRNSSSRDQLRGKYYTFDVGIGTCFYQGETVSGIYLSGLVEKDVPTC
ncbi:hypothetical protein J6590_097995, partial [Homalodisca vitripennis]